MSENHIKNSIFLEEKEEFPWDESALKAFKMSIRNEGINCCMDDIFLLGFLRARKFDKERSLQLLRNYQKIRLGYPQYFKDLLPSKLEHALSLSVLHFLPKPDQKGRFICMFEFSRWDTAILNAHDMLRGLMLCMDFQLNFHRTQVNSIVFIISGNGLSLSQFLQLTPKFIYSGVDIIFKNAYQLRFKELHFVNLNFMLKTLIRIAIPLLPRKLRKRVHLHNDMASLHKFISPECLSVEYGGTLPSFDPTEGNNVIRANEEFFRKNEEYLELCAKRSKKHVKMQTCIK